MDIASPRFHHQPQRTRRCRIRHSTSVPKMAMNQSRTAATCMTAMARKTPAHTAILRKQTEQFRFSPGSKARRPLWAQVSNCAGDWLLSKAAMEPAPRVELCCVDAEMNSCVRLSFKREVWLIVARWLLKRPHVFDVRPQLYYVRPNWWQSDSWAEISLPIDRWNDRRILANRLARESLRDVMDPLVRTCSSVNDIFEETWKLLSTPALNLCPVLANTSVCEHVLFFMLMTAWTTQHAFIDAVGFGQ